MRGWWWVGVGLLLCARAAAAAECDTAGPAHPEWIFCHDFEAPDASDFNTYWNDVYGVPERVFIIEDNPAGIAGGHAMRTQAVNDGDSELANGVTSGPKKFLGREVDYDAVYYRKYVRFNEGFDQGNFMHLGGLGACAPSDYPWDCMGHSGERPAGDDRFSSNLEPWSAYQSLEPPGRWGFYSYYHQMHMDCGHPGPDDCYGDMFAPDEDVLISRGDWHVLEMMIQPNTPGQADGYQSFWVDGVRAYTSPGINWRSDESLRINKAGIYLYVHHVPAHTECILDFDNVVISRAYIGPSRCQPDTPIAAPCLCGGQPDPDDASHVHSAGYCCAGSWQPTPCSQADGGSDGEGDGGADAGTDDGDGGDGGADAGTDGGDGAADAAGDSGSADPDAGPTDPDAAGPARVEGSCACSNPTSPAAPIASWLLLLLACRRTRRRATDTGT